MLVSSTVYKYVRMVYVYMIYKYRIQVYDMLSIICILVVYIAYDILRSMYSSRSPRWTSGSPRMLLVLVRELESLRGDCLLYTSPSPRDKRQSRMPSSA